MGRLLGLYGDGAGPARHPLALPLWDFLALVGQRLLLDERRQEPLWKLLARLSGHGPGEAPGHDFAAPDAWRLPPEWLRGIHTPEPWAWEVQRGRVRVLHPAWFDVLDVPQEGEDAEAQVRRELAAHAGHVPFSLAPGELPLDEHVTTPLHRWVGWLVPYVHVWLAHRLGPALSNPFELERTLLTLEARVHVSEERVDVTLPHTRLLPALHSAGLTRDLEPTPAMGRGLHFHFE